MNKVVSLIIVCIALWPRYGTCQELSYTHYDVKDGLAGSTVYCMTVDKEGFLWLGTENGLSRFDGTHFTNFTTRDGLPDNEIIELFTDSKGRVWMAPFRNAVCYYYRGKIHNSENDTVLAKVKPVANIRHIAEDAKGDILMDDYSRSRLYYISHTNKVIIFDSVNGQPITKMVTLSKSGKGYFQVQHGNRLYEFSGGKFTFNSMIDFVDGNQNFVLLAPFQLIIRMLDQIMINSNADHTIHQLTFPENFLKFSIIQDSLLIIGKFSGATIYNLNNFTHSDYLSNKPVTCAVTDQEGSLWFATKGEGIYRLNSKFVHNISLLGIRKNKLGVVSALKQPGNILWGTETAYLFTTALHKENIEIIEQPVLHTIEMNTKYNYIKLLDSSHYLFFGDVDIIKTEKKAFKFDTLISIGSIKSVATINPQQLFVGTSYYSIIFNPYSFKITDTIWNKRTTSVYYRNDTFYVGGLDGLYLINKNKTAQYWGATVPAFKNRIADMKESADGTLWIATNGDGVLAYKNQRIVAHITTDNGLSSNICRTLFAYKQCLWVGTDNGLNKIDFAHQYQVTKYSASDGLASNIINTILVDSNLVYVGTPEGISYFDETKLSFNSRSDLRITGITVAGKKYPADSVNFTIPHYNSNIQFAFVGISFRSAGDISYRYRLLGLDTFWQTTKETFLSYPTLPSGKYKLQLIAVNKFGIQSKIVSIPFTIEKRIRERVWFKLLLTGITATIIWLLLSLRIRMIRDQEKEKLKTSKRIAELEQLALKSQMNPHFIFNSLNSIQQYVIDKDVAGANKFISAFSHLMRQTLYFSSKQYISLKDELDYLATYLELEKNRLENVFDFKITVGENIFPSAYLISPMILQPFVENSVRHGVRYRKDKTGMILINVYKQNNYLVCVIEDDGIGRKASQQFKGNTVIEYQSKGMSLTNDRIALLNQNTLLKMKVLIEDLEDATGHGTGTKVIVHFPILEN